MLLFRFLSYSRRIRFGLFLHRVRSFYGVLVAFTLCVPRLRCGPLFLEGFVSWPVGGLRPFVVRRLFVEAKGVGLFDRVQNGFCILDFFFLAPVCYWVFYGCRAVDFGELGLLPLIAFVPSSCRNILGCVLYFYPVRNCSGHRSGRFVFREGCIISRASFLRLCWGSK